MHLNCKWALAVGKTFPTLDPRSGEVIAQVSEGDTEDINRAVLAARKAFDHGPWPKMSAYVFILNYAIAIGYLPVSSFYIRNVNVTVGKVTDHVAFC